MVESIARMIGAARKFLRFGTCVDAFMSSVSSTGQYYSSSVLQVVVTLSRISNAMFLFCDHLLWLQSINLMKINLKYWDNLADR